MNMYEQLQQDIDKAFAAHERDGAHLVLLPSIIFSKMVTQLGIPKERLKMTEGRETSAKESIPPQPERGEIYFNITVIFPIKKYEPLSATVQISATYDRYQYKIKCDGYVFEVVNTPEVDQEYLARVVTKIGGVLNAKVGSFLTN